MVPFSPSNALQCSGLRLHEKGYSSISANDGASESPSGLSNSMVKCNFRPQSGQCSGISAVHGTLTKIARDALVDVAFHRTFVTVYVAAGR